MNLFIDCEYNDFKGPLISMALVAENGAEWYEVVLCENPSAWVAEHVMPILHKAPLRDKAELTKSLACFLADFDTVHIVADWPEDIAHFCSALITTPGSRIDTPPLTFEIVRDDFDSAMPHNALADARGIRHALMGYNACSTTTCRHSNADE